jgi:predicted CopG family antitoxin
MIGQIKIDSKLWTKFAEEAKRSKRDPARVLSELLREYIGQKERQRLNQQTIKAAKRSGITEDENIEDLIKGLRKKRLAKA